MTLVKDIDITFRFIAQLLFLHDGSEKFLEQNVGNRILHTQQHGQLRVIYQHTKKKRTKIY